MNVHRPIADCANERTAEWIARALVLQSHNWVDAEPPRRSFARGFVFALPLALLLWSVFA